MKQTIVALFKKQHGITLIELLVALVIAGLLSGLISTSIFQLMKINEQNSHSITAQRQVQQVGFYISRDIQMSQKVTRGINNGFPLILRWDDLTGNSFQVTYSMNNGVITKTEVINSTTTSKQIAEYISAISIVQNADGVYDLGVTATVSGSRTVSETRTYDIKQRTS